MQYINIIKYIKILENIRKNLIRKQLYVQYMNIIFKKFLIEKVSKRKCFLKNTKSSERNHEKILFCILDSVFIDIESIFLYHWLYT